MSDPQWRQSTPIRGRKGSLAFPTYLNVSISISITLEGGEIRL